MMRRMTKLGLWSLAAAVPCALAGLSTSCGSTSCEDLNELCPHCPNVTYRDNCQTMVARDVLETCSAELPTFERVCVVENPDYTQHTTTSTQPNGGSGGTGGTAVGGGGAGGQASGGGGTGGTAVGGGGAGGAPGGAGGS